MIDKTPTGQTKMTMHTVIHLGEKATLYMRGDVCKDGKVRVSEDMQYAAFLLVNSPAENFYGAVLKN